MATVCHNCHREPFSILVVEHDGLVWMLLCEIRVKIRENDGYRERIMQRGTAVDSKNRLIRPSKERQKSMQNLPENARSRWSGRSSLAQDPGLHRWRRKDLMR